MISNSSKSAKTLKNQIYLMDRDSWVLDSVQKFVKYQDNLVVPFENVLDDYKDYLSTLLIEVEVPKEYFYSPTGFSNYYYGDPGLDYLVLYFSNITSLFEFNKEKIKVFPVSQLSIINKIAVSYKNDIEKNKAEMK